MRPSEYLRQGWCQGTLARNKDGESGGLARRDAVAWCMDGALRQARYDGGIDGMDCVHIQDSLYRLLPPTYTTWNDAPGRTQEEVAAMMERAEREVLDET